MTVRPPYYQYILERWVPNIYSFVRTKISALVIALVLTVPTVFLVEATFGRAEAINRALYETRRDRVLLLHRQALLRTRQLKLEEQLAASKDRYWELVKLDRFLRGEGIEPEDIYGVATLVESAGKKQNDE